MFVIGGIASGQAWPWGRHIKACCTEVRPQFPPTEGHWDRLGNDPDAEEMDWTLGKSANKAA